MFVFNLVQASRMFSHSKICTLLPMVMQENAFFCTANLAEYS